MTRTSATRPAPEVTRAGGFSLLEMLVVLTLMGLVVALVAPAGFRMIASWQRATQAEGVLGQLSALPDVARREARPISLAPGEPLSDRITVPDGWRLELQSPLDIRSNGACSGTSGELIDEGGVPLAFTLEAPYCRIRLVDR